MSWHQFSTTQHHSNDFKAVELLCADRGRCGLVLALLAGNERLRECEPIVAVNGSCIDRFAGGAAICREILNHLVTSDASCDA